MEVDYLIIGQGIAGSNLAFELLQRNKKIFVIDAFQKNSSSRVSAGICNPITGKRLSKTWLADVIFPLLKDFYTKFEDFLQVKFLRELPVYRTFKNIENQNEWYVRTMQAEWENFCAVTSNTNIDYQKNNQETTHQAINNAHFGLFLDNPLGGWHTLNSYQVEVNILLENFRNYLKNENLLSEEYLDYEKIKIFPEYITYSLTNTLTKDLTGNQSKNITLKAKKIIFCEGINAQQNPFFQNLPFNFVKGEWLKIKPETPKNTFLKGIINQEGIFVLPNTPTNHIKNEQEHRWIIGATYEWDNMNTDITQEARKSLTEKLDNFIKIPYTIIDQQAGIRPASKNRQPFLQLHPQYPQLGIINGLGTKGVSLSPYFSKIFCDFLENKRNDLDIEKVN